MNGFRPRRPLPLVALFTLAFLLPGCKTRPTHQKATPASAPAPKPTAPAADAKPPVPSPAVKPTASAAKPALARAERPKIGSPVRAAIMDALRTPVEKELTKPVKFLVGHGLKVAGDWAFLSGKVVTPAGKPFDFHGTRFEAAIKAGAFDDGIFALLKKTPAGAWRVTKYRIGCTDVCWEGWQVKYRAPASVFP